MNTIVTNKRQFLSWIKKQLDNKDIILMTQNISGTCEYRKKTNEKRITFSFAANTFVEKESVGDLAFGKIPTLAITVCNKKQIAPESLKLITEKKKPHPSPTTQKEK